MREANKLIIAYNKSAKNTKKLVLCDKHNLAAWMSIPARIKADIQGTALDKLFDYVFKRKSTYLKACQSVYISETTFYTKMKSIYDSAINYMYYEHLFVLGDCPSFYYTPLTDSTADLTDTKGVTDGRGA